MKNLIPSANKHKDGTSRHFSNKITQNIQQIKPEKHQYSMDSDHAKQRTFENLIRTLKYSIRQYMRYPEAGENKSMLY